MKYEKEVDKLIKNLLKEIPDKDHPEFYRLLFLKSLEYFLRTPSNTYDGLMAEYFNTFEEISSRNNLLLPLRRMLRWTQKQMSSALGVPLRQYQNYERGNELPDFNIAERAAKIFGLSIDDIFPTLYMRKKEKGAQK